MSFGLTVSITMVWYDWGDTNDSSFEVDKEEKVQVCLPYCCWGIALRTHQKRDTCCWICCRPRKEKKRKQSFLEDASRLF